MAVNSIIFENENARLLFCEVISYFPEMTMGEEEELTEQMALEMYNYVKSKASCVSRSHY